MFKCIYSLVPDYITDIIPPHVQKISNYLFHNCEIVSNFHITRTIIGKFHTYHVYFSLVFSEDGRMGCVGVVGGGGGGQSTD